MSGAAPLEELHRLERTSGGPDDGRGSLDHVPPVPDRPLEHGDANDIQP
jgi:hypothetical protein